jgi:benzoyl-CoA reductase/2-hydroxyglutaryl-CoA dehydratase subunit BcrC/BadD/HgdB
MVSSAYDRLQLLFDNYPQYLSKQLADGKKLIATICPYVPPELVEQAGAINVPMTLSHAIGRPDLVLEGENTLYPDICSLPKGFYGVLAKGVCPKPALIAVACTCDHRVKTAEVLHYEGYDVFFLGVPRTETPNALQYIHSEYQRFTAKLEELTGNRMRDDELRRRMEVRNKTRVLFREVLEELKYKRYSVARLFKFMVGSMNFAPEDFLVCIESLLEELRNQRETPRDDRPRILSLGSMPFDPLGYYSFLAEQCNLIMADLFRVRILSQPIETEGDILNNLARAHMATQCECHAPNEERVDTLVRLISDYQIGGVIYHIFTPCQTFALGRYKLLAKLDSLGIPHLTIQTDYLMQNQGQMETRIQAFLEMINERRRK